MGKVERSLTLHVSPNPKQQVHMKNLLPKRWPDAVLLSPHCLLTHTSTHSTGYEGWSSNWSLLCSRLMWPQSPQNTLENTSTRVKTQVLGLALLLSKRLFLSKDSTCPEKTQVLGFGLVLFFEIESCYVTKPQVILCLGLSS